MIRRHAFQGTGPKRYGRTTRVPGGLLLLVLLLTGATAADGNAAGPAEGAVRATWSIIGGGDRQLLLEVRLDGLAAVDGQTATAGRLVAVPPGLRATARLLAWESLDPDVAGAPPRVRVGAPTRWAGQDVVALSLEVGAPATGAGRSPTAVRLTVGLDFEPDGAAAARRERAPRPVAPSLTSLAAAHVLGLASKSAPADVPGTWAVVCRSATVASHLAPLIAWRARQGYHVETIVGLATATAIKDRLQAIHDDPSLPPLEFIVLAGDTESAALKVPTWIESLSGYAGTGDHDYALLEGDDILADAHVGRLSCVSLASLDQVVAKILAYEQSPPMDDTAWFRAACVMGDPTDSGVTTVYVNQWLKGQLLARGYASVDTVWSGNFVAAFMASLQAGRSAFGYRGFDNMSGIQPGHIESLTNGGRLPVAILPTCETGSFRGADTCHSEAFLRAPAGGAIAAIATATSGTHTRYNNCFYTGVWDGLLNGQDPRIGVAHTLGKLEIYLNYFPGEPEAAEIWAVWNNIMGDPASPIWLDVPRVLEVDHVATAAVGATSLAFSVASQGQPVGDALVCVSRDGAAPVSGRTDDLGHLALDLPALAAGAARITVTGRGLLPYLGQVAVGPQAGAALAAVPPLFDDDATGASRGNGDGLPGPGETLEIRLAVTNLGAAPALGIAGLLSGGAPGGGIAEGFLSFADTAPGDTTWCDAPAVVTIAADARDGDVVRFPLEMSAGGLAWPGVVSVPVRAPAPSVGAVTWSAGATFAPGQSGQLTIQLANTGSLPAGAADAVLETESPWLQVDDAEGAFGPIVVGGTGDNAADPFGLSIDSACFGGHLAGLSLALTWADGQTAKVPLTIAVGSVAEGEPTGPGDGGYYAFDDTDVASGYAPVFDWVALDPAHGGPGQDLGLGDFGWEQDDTRTIDLPFRFRFHGVDFDQVSICSNGWLAMGETPLRPYHNTSLPGKGAPGGLIAPFWDNLHQEGDRRVYTHHDPAGHRFIVQWYNLPNDFSGALQNFEVILLDPVWHPTGTGDGAVIFQYAAVADTDSRDAYATVGLQNLARTGGLQYAFWNQLAPGAAPLQPGRAIRFQPLGTATGAMAAVTPAAVVATVPAGGTHHASLRIVNVGTSGPGLGFAIDAVDPAVLLPPAAVRAEGGGAGDKSIQGSTLACATGLYEPGSTQDLAITVSTVSLMGFLSRVEIHLPAGVTLEGGTTLATSAGSTLPWTGAGGESAFAVWDGRSGSTLNYLPNGSVAHATISVSFAPWLVAPLTVAWRLQDEGLVGGPDEVNGAFVLGNDRPSVQVGRPAAGDRVVIGRTVDVDFTAYNLPGEVTVSLQREEGGAWATLATGVPAAAGTWSWLVDGEPGAHAVIRVTDSLDPAVHGQSGVFAVSRDLGWLHLAATSGVVPTGGEVELDLELNGSVAGPGLHQAVLRVATSDGVVVDVPVTLTVTAAATVPGAVPGRVALRGAWPNPCNPATVVMFALTKPGYADLSVFDARGSRIRQLVAAQLTAGEHRATWDGTDEAGRPVASGTYLLRLVAEQVTETRKLTLAR
ncbi:MAG: hypothetical protein IPK64_13740 [bacterium]|nr:hypothetical protein [bacterium]